MIKKDILVKNEMKHLSKEYRTNYQKMNELLHEDFFEIGESGNTYNKEDILSAIPLTNHNFQVRNFSFFLEGDYINTRYTLIRDFTNENICEAKWIKSSSNLKLIYFKIVKEKLTK